MLSPSVVNFYWTIFDKSGTHVLSYFSCIMGSCVSACVQMLTRIHDKRNYNKDRQREQAAEAAGDGNTIPLAPAEKQPSVLLVFSIIHRQNNEKKIISFLRKVFAQDPGLIRQINSDGETLLYFACKQGKLEVMNYLLSQETINKETREIIPCAQERCSHGTGLHALVHAMDAGKVSHNNGCNAMEELLQHGCDIEAKTNMLMEERLTAFFLAAKLACCPALRKLSARGCNVNVVSGRDMTALHLSAANGSLAAVHILAGK